MTLQIIDPKKLSFEEISSDIQTFIKQKSDYNRWKDFNVSGAGTTIAELHAGLGSFLAYHAISSRREAYLDTAILYTSAINICSMLGYPVNRVSAPKLRLTLNNSGAPQYWNRTIPIGVVNDLNMSLTTSQWIRNGINTIDVVVGEWIYKDLSTNENTDFQRIIVEDEGIENDKSLLELKINGVNFELFDYSDEALERTTLAQNRTFVLDRDPLTSDNYNLNFEIGDLIINETSYEVFQMTEATLSSATWESIGTAAVFTASPNSGDDIYSGYKVGDLWFNETDGTIFISFSVAEDEAIWERIGINRINTSVVNGIVLKTVYNGVALLFGDGVIGQSIGSNDIIEFNYIKTNGRLGLLQINPDDVDLNIGEATEITVLSPGYERDEIDKLKYIAGGFHAAGGRMVTDDDHIYYLLSYAGDLISAGFNKEEDVCCTINLSYLFLDEHIISDSEEELIQEYLNNYKMQGEQIILQDPIVIGLILTATVIVEEGIDESDLKDSIREVIRDHTMQLGKTFHLGDINYEINQLDGVERVYIVSPVSDRELAYNEYIKLIDDNLDNITITSDRTTAVSINPENTGYIES